MAKKKPADPATIDVLNAHSEADIILLSLRVATSTARQIEEEFAHEMEALQQRYAVQIDEAKQTLATLEADLMAFAKAHKSALFVKEDTRLDLKNGALIYTIEKRVKRIRAMLTKLEAAGKTELIKIAKSVDWDSVEKLTDAELVALGTSRKPKDVFSYEIKG